jgi:hypothetical protein
MESDSGSDINFESDNDSKSISFVDDSHSSRNNNKFSFKKDYNNIRNNEQVNIKPMLNKDDMESRHTIRKPSLTGRGNVRLDDIELLTNTKKMNNNSDSASDNDIHDNISNEFESDSEDEVSSSHNSRHSDSHTNNIDFGGDDDDDDDDDVQYNKVDDEEDDDDDDEDEMTYEQIQKMKAEIIYKLNRLDKLGYKPSRRYSMASNLEDLKFEYNTLKRQRSIEKSVKFSRKLLMAFISGSEFLNSKFDYFNLKLDKWSEHTMENIGDYDEVFEELHDKHEDSFEMAPELRLLLMVGGSGFMYHMQQSLFQSATPEISDILRQNPDIMRSVSQAAAGNMAQSIAREENDPDAEPMLNMMMGNKPRRMDEPSGVDDILEELGKNTRKSGLSDDIPTRNIEFNSKKKKRIKKGIQLDI